MTSDDRSRERRGGTRRARRAASRARSVRRAQRVGGRRAASRGDRDDRAPSRDRAGARRSHVEHGDRTSRLPIRATSRRTHTVSIAMSIGVLGDDDRASRRSLVLLIAALFCVGGIMHFVAPTAYVRIVPAVASRADDAGAGQRRRRDAGGVGVLIPATRVAAGWGLIALLVAVFPANVLMLQTAHEPVRRPLAGDARPATSAAARADLWVWRAVIRTRSMRPALTRSRGARHSGHRAVRRLVLAHADERATTPGVEHMRADAARLPGPYVAPRGGIWVAVAGDEIVGCVALRPLPDGRRRGEANVRRPGVARHWRRSRAARTADRGRARAWLSAAATRHATGDDRRPRRSTARSASRPIERYRADEMIDTCFFQLDLQR